MGSDGEKGRQSFIIAQVPEQRVLLRLRDREDERILRKEPNSPGRHIAAQDVTHQ